MFAFMFAITYLMAHDLAILRITNYACEGSTGERLSRIGHLCILGSHQTLSESLEVEAPD